MWPWIVGGAAALWFLTNKKEAAAENKLAEKTVLVAEDEVVWTGAGPYAGKPVPKWVAVFSKSVWASEQTAAEVARKTQEYAREGGTINSVVTYPAQQDGAWQLAVQFEVTFRNNGQTVGSGGGTSFLPLPLMLMGGLGLYIRAR